MITEVFKSRDELAQLEERARKLAPHEREIQPYAPGAVHRLADALKRGDVDALRQAVEASEAGLAESRRPKPLTPVEPAAAYVASQLGCSASEVQYRVNDLAAVHRATEGDLRRLALHGEPSLSGRLLIASELGRAPDDLAAAVKSSLRRAAPWSGYGAWPRRWAERVETLVGTPPQLTGEPRRQATADRLSAAIGVLADSGEWRAVRWLVKLHAQIAASCVPQDGESDPEFVAAVATEQLERHMRA